MREEEWESSASADCGFSVEEEATLMCVPQVVDMPLYSLPNEFTRNDSVVENVVNVFFKRRFSWC
jgi:hypothetical protein